jgi:hypothetical protein
VLPSTKVYFDESVLRFSTIIHIVSDIVTSWLTEHNSNEHTER